MGDLPCLQVCTNDLLPYFIDTHLLLVNSTLCGLSDYRTPTGCNMVHQITGGAFITGVSADCFATTLCAETGETLDSFAIDILDSDLGAEVSIDPGRPFALLVRCVWE
jgi:hypothetical protein